MPKLNLTICGKSFTFSCGEGQEAIINEAAKKIDEKFNLIQANKSISEMTALVMASLLVSSELLKENEDIKQNQNSSMLQSDMLEKTINEVKNATRRINDVALNFKND
ncbi:MAG: cell division protein ZapA [Alphaproteobacteria bacterium]|nr:cell division protein ZapA [Alphaproteobacteria bacterium]